MGERERERSNEECLKVLSLQCSFCACVHARACAYLRASVCLCMCVCVCVCVLFVAVLSNLLPIYQLRQVLVTGAFSRWACGTNWPPCSSSQGSRNTGSLRNKNDKEKQESTQSKLASNHLFATGDRFERSETSTCDLVNCVLTLHYFKLITSESLRTFYLRVRSFTLGGFLLVSL